MSVAVYAEGTGVPRDEKVSAPMAKHFDLRPHDIVTMPDLLRLIFEKTATFGRFGRDEPEFTRDRTDRAALLGDAAGIKTKP